jgi:hypothetical protein
MTKRVKDSAKHSPSGGRTATVQQQAISPKINSKTQSSPTRNQIATRAYQIWQENGSRHGRDELDWLQAESELCEQLNQN